MPEFQSRNIHFDAKIIIERVVSSKVQSRVRPWRHNTMGEIDWYHGTKEAATLLGCRPITIRRRMKAGKIPYVSIGRVRGIPRQWVRERIGYRVQLTPSLLWSTVCFWGAGAAVSEKLVAQWLSTQPEAGRNELSVFEWDGLTARLWRFLREVGAVRPDQEPDRSRR